LIGPLNGSFTQAGFFADKSKVKPSPAIALDIMTAMTRR
jgi:hypothetical protein